MSFAAEFTRFFFTKTAGQIVALTVQLQAGQILPVAYSLPHGELTISSSPSGAEILLPSAETADPTQRPQTPSELGPVP